MSDFREKVMGCWLGKAAGGTLGQPYEGCDGPLRLSGYDPVPTDMIPNDDLDLQVLWACVLQAMEQPCVDRDVFATTWLKHVEFPWDEYGVALWNLRKGIPAPHCGKHDNWFKDGLGAAIRSEIWACLAPGNPTLAAAFAYEDACVDHVGDGIYAAQFLAALESAAFTESRIETLVEAGLSVIPADCRLARALRDTIGWCSESADWQLVRTQILDHWGSENFTDVVMNLPFVVMALLLGQGDFSKTVCLAANCGRDADCTAASAGAILGIINPASIGSQWLLPIGRKLILNDGIKGITHPDTLDEFTNLIVALRKRVLLREETTSNELCLERHAIQAECGIFAPWFAQDDSRFQPQLPADTEKRQFAGNHGWISADCVPADSLYMMRFTFEIKEPCQARVMFNSTANCRVWLDGNYLFGREGGRMAPSFHRCPINQYKDLHLTPGTHQLLAGVAPVGKQKLLEWVFGIGDIKTKQWLTEVKYH
jgi:ADP-ribosylglycohydrolase